MRKLKQLWEDFLIRGEELQYQASPARAELARNRLEIYRKFMSGDKSCINNPYTHPESYNLY